MQVVYYSGDFQAQRGDSTASLLGPRADNSPHSFLLQINREQKSGWLGNEDMQRLAAGSGRSLLFWLTSLWLVVLLSTPAACCCSTHPSNMQKKKDSFPGLQEVLLPLDEINNGVCRLLFKPSPQPPTAASLVSGQICSIVNVCAKQCVRLSCLKLMRATLGAGSGG